MKTREALLAALERCEGCGPPAAVVIREHGYALVPLEPTEAMVVAGFNAKPLPPMRAKAEHYRLAYKAMLKSSEDSPSPPEDAT